MKLSLLSVLALGIAVVSAVVPAAAHHSFSAEYDAKKPVTLTGTVSNVEWMNPHVYFYLDVTGEDGKVANWAFEMGPPNGLQRSGWTRNTIKIGDELTVNGTLAKDGSKQVNARTVTITSTGKQLGAASSEGKGN
jgi:hypothetical protein